MEPVTPPNPLQLQQLNEVTYVVVGPSTPSDEESLDDFLGQDEEVDELEEMSDLDEEMRSTDADTKSASSESASTTLLSPDVPASMSEAEFSPLLLRKKYRAPLPPALSPHSALRHSYDFDSKALRTQTSTDTDSTNSESRLMYQTSTDSESFVMVESAGGSNFPGELAGLESFHTHSALRSSAGTTPYSSSSRGVSTLSRLRDVFRSPQITRRKTMRDTNDRPKTIRARKTRLEEVDQSATRSSKLEEGIKSPKVRGRQIDPVAGMSDWVLACGHGSLRVEQEFEVQRLPDYESFLSQLLDNSDPSQPDYDVIMMNLRRVRSLMVERDEHVTEVGTSPLNSPELKLLGDPLHTEDNSIPKNTSSSELTNNIPKNRSSTDLTNNIPKNTSSTDLTNNNIGASNPTSNNNVNNASSPTSNNNNHDSNISLNSTMEESLKEENKKRRRRKSAPSALLFKSTSNSKTKNSPSPRHSSGHKRDQLSISPLRLVDCDSNKRCLMEGPVHFYHGVQSQDRYLFLFNDLLLVTKQKSNSTYKLKHKVPLCHMWIASCMEEVSETSRPADRSFVVGWPTTNLVASFPSVDLQKEWLVKLSENITIAKEQMAAENNTTSIKVALKDRDANTRPACQVEVNNFTQAKDVIKECLKQLDMSESDPKDYQLWVVSGTDGSPYPLIGHETPYSIKTGQTRTELSRTRSGNSLDTMTAADLDASLEIGNSGGPEQKCEFYLRQRKNSRKNNFDDSAQQKVKMKNKKSPKILNKIFRRGRKHQVFGVPLADICDENLDPPEPIIRLIVLVYQQGPHTPGILRKGYNAALGKQIREKIDAGDKYALEEHMTPTAASLFKEFLRSLPDGLLVSSLHDQWLAIKQDDPYENKISRIKSILAKLPPVNYHLMKLTFCLLQHLAKHSAINQMGPSNLATCIAPSIYISPPKSPVDSRTKENAQTVKDSVSDIQNVVVPLIAFLIIYHMEVFGEDILVMFVKYGCQPSPPGSLQEEKYDQQVQPSGEEDEEDDIIAEEDFEDHFSSDHLNTRLRLQQQQHRKTLRDSNSGTDSDSMHSVLSMPDAGMGLHRDDSSIDSLGERDYYSQESPKVGKSHLSPSNLSRDSGLTLSDNQLYDEEAYHGDVKLFQQRGPHFAGHHSMVSYDTDSFTRSVPASFDNSQPVAPPRRRSLKKKAETRSDGLSDSSSQKPPLKHSFSATDLETTSFAKSSQRSQKIQMLNHVSLDKQLSNNSIEEEGTVNNIIPMMDFYRNQGMSDFGTLVKSDSGAHLFLNEDTIPTDFTLESPDGKQDSNFSRWGYSTTDYSVSASPQSRRSQSSADSVISDSVYGVSREGSIASAPQTPDEQPDKSLSWLSDITLPGKPWEGLFPSSLATTNMSAHSKSTNELGLPIVTLSSPLLPSSHSKSTSDLAMQVNSSAGDDPENLDSTAQWPLKSHEAEEVQLRDKRELLHNTAKPRVNSIGSTYTFSDIPPQLHLGDRFYKHAPNSKSLIGAKEKPCHKDTSLSSARMKKAAMTLPESSTNSNSSELRFSKEMQAIQLDEYIHAQSRPIIISPDKSSSAVSNVSTSAKLAKYISPKMDQPLFLRDKELTLYRPKQSSDKSLSDYQTAQRNFVRKYNAPIDLTKILQQQQSAKAKAAYEKSLQIYEQENKVDGTPLTHNNDGSHRIPFGMSTEAYQDLTTGNVSALSSFYRRKDQDGSEASGNMEKMTISHGILDTEERPNPKADRITAANRSKSMGNLVSLSRNDSKLSDTGSTSSTITISTLSVHSDSTGRYSDISDISRVTESSATSNDNSFEMTRPGVEANCSPVGHPAPEKSSEFETIDDDDCEVEVEEEEEDINDIYAVPKVNPETLYLKSMQMYEQNIFSTPASTPKQGRPLSQIITSSSIHPQREMKTLIGKYDNPTTSARSELPKTSLHRYNSASVDHINKLGLSNTPGTESKHAQSKRSGTEWTLPTDFKSDHHEKFLKAKLNFLQGDVAKNSTSTSCSSQTGHLSAFSPNIRPVTAALLNDVPYADTREPCRRQSRSELPWSVKDLKTRYDKPDSKPPGSSSGSSVKTNSSCNSVSTSQSSSPSRSRPHSPPPYQNPPPFRPRSNSLQRSASSSSSSSDKTPTVRKTSAASANKTIHSQRLGPQSYSQDPGHSCSSSEESFSSSPNRRHTWLSDSSNEELSDHTSTTYI